MMEPAGRRFLSYFVIVMSQFSPLPSAFRKEGVSSQSMSTPSIWLSMTNWASLIAQSTGSYPAEVGVWVDPKALIMSFTLLLVKFFLRVVWISLLVVPQPLGPMLPTKFAHIPLASCALPGQVQKVRATQLQGRGVAVKPGTAKAAGRVRFPHQEVSLLMQMNLMGKGLLLFPWETALISLCCTVSVEAATSNSKRQRANFTLMKIQQNRWTIVAQMPKNTHSGVNSLLWNDQQNRILYYQQELSFIKHQHN